MTEVPPARFRGVSHIAIGVTDVDRALGFYRDLLGLRVVRRSDDQPAVVTTESASDEAPSRGQVVHLAWSDGPFEPFLTLTRHAPVLGDRGLPLNHVGANHVGFWVDGFRDIADRLTAAGVPVVMAPLLSDSDQYPGGTGTVISMMVTDPDGTVIQIEQRDP